MTQLFNLPGKTVLITGAAQGIGQGIAKLFAEAGATCILTDIQDELGQDTASQIPRARYIHLDVREEGDWRLALAHLQEQDLALDVLINNAGITGFQGDFGPQDPENVSIEDWHRVHAINLDGVFLGCKYAIQAMKKNGGTIVNIASRSGNVGIPTAAAYSSSKAAVRNYTKTVALYCAGEGYNIRCNSVHPAAILTPMWEPMLGDGEHREAAIQAIASECPLQRFGMPSDVAHAALYLASEASSFLTGIELHVDGGIMAGSAATPRNN